MRCTVCTALGAHARFFSSPERFFSRAAPSGQTKTSRRGRPAKWETVEPWREAVPKDAIPKTSWWTVFHDDDLDTLESELLVANETLKVAFAHYDQARASAAVQNAQLFPTLSVDPAAERQRYSGTRPSGSYAPR